MTTCIITGCALIRDGDSLWGDLYTEGDCWVFNGATWPNGESIWQRDVGIPSHLKCLVIQEGVYYFEKRGIFVISRAFASLNQVARDYLAPPKGKPA